MASTIDGASAPTIVNSSVARTREYLTGNEVEELMAAARKSSRYGHRDATMILVAYRHGLRASEVCDLQCHKVELNAGRLRVRRAEPLFPWSRETQLTPPCRQAARKNVTLRATCGWISACS